MIDNFELITNYLKKVESEIKLDRSYDNIVWYLQILKRKKDNPDTVASNTVVIKDYYFNSADEMLDKKENIIKYCVDNNARAYIRLNPRCNSSIIKQMLKDSVAALDNCSSIKLNKIISGAVGNSSIPKSYGNFKTWIIDIDTNDREFIDEVKCSILDIAHDYMSAEDFKEFSKSMFEIPTKNGVHVICKPFNLKQLGERFADLKSAKRFADFVDIHKDNPTILYMT